MGMHSRCWESIRILQAAMSMTRANSREAKSMHREQLTQFLATWKWSLWGKWAFTLQLSTGPATGYILHYYYYLQVASLWKRETTPVKISAFARRLHVIYTPAHRLQHGCTVENACTTPVTVRWIACTRSLLLVLSNIMIASPAARPHCGTYKLFSDTSPAPGLLFPT